MKLIALIPHYRNIEPECQASIINTITAMKQIGVSFELIQTETNLVPFARSDLLRLALEYGADKVLFIDSDMEFNPIDITLMLDANKPIIGGLYVSKFFPMRYHAYNLHDQKNYTFVEITKIPDEPFKCDGIGAGFLMIDRKVIEHMSKPEVIQKYGRSFNLWQKENGLQVGEDFSFCIRAKLLGYEVWCDPRVNLGHIGVKKYTKLEYNVSQGNFYNNDIQGWMSVEELNWLFNQSKKVESIIELGAWKGKSTHALCSGCPGTVTVVDHFKGSEEEKENDGPHKEADEINIKEEFMRNVGNRFKNLSVISTHISEALPLLSPSDMVFVDGSHKYEDVKADLRALSPFAKKLFCGHDINWPEVNHAVDDVIGINNIEIYERIWIQRR